jgi:hypothetical protein
MRWRGLQVSRKVHCMVLNEEETGTDTNTTDNTEKVSLQ